jgi:glycosyltransferase involved in cell wall biosynthesis
VLKGVTAESLHWERLSVLDRFSSANHTRADGSRVNTSGHVMTDVLETPKPPRLPGRAQRDPKPISVAIVHDYLTQRGGAERVVLLLAEAFPSASIHTSLYDPDGTFPEFSTLDVQTTPLNRFGVLRHRHRLAFPVLAPSFSALHVDANVLLCSSSGWAHGTRTEGRKVVYCYAPARWLYQSDRYIGKQPQHAGPQSLGSTVLGHADALRRNARAAALHLVKPPLRRWDQHAASSADRYLTSSTVMADAIRTTYGLEAEVLPPPPALTSNGPEHEVSGLDPGYFLCIARLLPYKNVQVVAEAAGLVPGARLVIVGDGPARSHIQRIAGPNVRFLGQVDDQTLRWLYRNSLALVSASFEDYGLTPLEAASFGRPSVVLRSGGFLDTVVDGLTGTFFDAPVIDHVARAMKMATKQTWDEDELQAHAEKFSEASFKRRIRQVIAEEVGRA